jgi:hypothetical protein
MSPHSSRHRFIALVEELRRVLGFPETPMPDTEPDDALLLTVEVDGSAFELMHPPWPHDERFLLECLLGPPPEDEVTRAGLLQANLELAREQRAVFCVRSESGVATYSTWVSMDDVDADQLVGAMRELAPLSAQWRTGAWFAAAEA